LYINNNANLTNLPELSGLTNLSSLVIVGNANLTSLPELSGLTNLSSLLILGNANLTNLPDLSGLTNLSSLDIVGNANLTNLSDLSGLTNLSYLQIVGNANLQCVGGYPEQLTIQEIWPPVCGEGVTYQVGDLAEGGIVFYVDETGEHGLVAAMEDMEGSYQWGCYETSISGADGESIGTGYQNTLDIVSECSETPIAASEALAYESEGYSDWYLPSKDELIEMYNTIGNGSPEGDIGGFGNNWYWSSSVSNTFSAWNVYFNNGYTTSFYKYITIRVRVIRAF